MVMKSEPKYIIEQRERMDGAEWKRVDGYDTLAMVKEEYANWRKLDAHRYTYRYGRNPRYGNDYFIDIECTKEAVNKLVEEKSLILVLRSGILCARCSSKALHQFDQIPKHYVKMTYR